MIFSRAVGLLILLSLAAVAPTRVLGQPAASGKAPYQPTAENLAARDSFRQARFGVFIHWGVYSALGRGEWAMNNEGITIEKYNGVAQRFNPVKYDPDEWVRLFKRAGAKYVTITSKHHDGFAMWDSQQTDWDVVDSTPYKRDILKPLAEACRRHGLKLFFYHSHLDWHHPDYFPRGLTGHSSGRPDAGEFNRYLDFMDAQLAELLGGAYGEVGGIWFDGWWDQQTKKFENTKDADPLATRIDWRLRQTYDSIHRLQPACLVGNNHHVSPFQGEDFQMFERDLPGENAGGFSHDAKIGDLPLETCDTLNGNWGYDSRDQNFKSVKQCVHYLVKAAGRDANLLLNIGPRPDGTIDPESAARLEGIGAWLKKFERSVRPTRGGPVAPQAWGVSTQSDSTVYLHVLDPSAADAEGWLTLVGARDVEFGEIADFADAAPVEHRRDPSGDLQIRHKWDAETFDTVFCLTK